MRYPCCLTAFDGDMPDLPRRSRTLARRQQQARAIREPRGLPHVAPTLWRKRRLRTVRRVNAYDGLKFSMLIGKSHRAGDRFPVGRPCRGIPLATKVVQLLALGQDSLVRAVGVRDDEVTLVAIHPDKSH